MPAHALETVSVLPVLKAFSAGCSALTGVEAIANGVLPRAPWVIGWVLTSAAGTAVPSLQDGELVAQDQDLCGLPSLLMPG